MPKPRRLAVTVGTVTALVAVAGAGSLLPGAGPRAAAAGLVPYADCAALLTSSRAQLRASASSYGAEEGGRLSATGIGAGVERAAAPAAGDSAAGVQAAGNQAAGSRAGAPALGRGGTGTNLQEQDVDEPDRAKLRNGSLVVLARQRLVVLSAAATPTVVGSLPLGSDVAGGELLLTGNRALLVLQNSGDVHASGAPSGTGSLVMPRPGRPATRLLLVDLADPARPELIEESTYSGTYVSARLVGGTVRLVTSSTPSVAWTWPWRPGRAAERAARTANSQAVDRLTVEDVLPSVRRRDGRGKLLQQGPAVDCAQVQHAQDSQGSSTLLVTTLRPGDGLAAADSTAVTAHGDLVYASSDRLYVATSRWGTTGPVPLDDAPPASDRTDTSVTAGRADAVTTQVHAFDTTSARRTRYVGTGSVPGYVLGRWALSEHQGVLRVATTRQPPWDAAGAAQTSSSVVVLAERDGALVEQGRVDGLGKGERIQAVRYFGTLAAVVTFRQVDPLYLVDLAPRAPRVLGELKVPGFSTYLHPLGDGLLLGLGQDADTSGRVTGMQASVFDLRDLRAPRQVDRLPLGPGWSPALDDSRAFGYDPARRLATLPMLDEGEGAAEAAAVGIEVRKDGRLREVGRLRVTGVPPDRVLADATHVYAVSSSGVTAGNADTMTATGTVELPR